MAAMAIIASAASCKMVQPEETGTQLTITASTEVGGTKTTLKDNSTDVYWQPGDEIKLFSGSGSGRFVSTLSSEAKTSEFTGTLGFVFGVNEGGDGDGTLVALYPYSAEATFDGTAISTTLTGAQTGKTGSFAPGQFISVARSSGSLMMYFYNVLGGVRFSLKQEGIHTVTFRGNDDEVLGGAITIGWDEDGYPVVTEASDTVKTLTITAPDGETFKVGEYYYISALPKSLVKGYTMTFTGDNKTGTYTSTTPVTIRRSAFGTLTQADKDVEYVTPFDAVDLGLSVKWATCNVGASKPEDYGDYYAWGETETKSDYSWSTYKWMASGQADWKYINKYQSKDGRTTACWYDSDGNFIGDGKTVLETADDVAAQKWGSKWRMPTDSEWAELRNTGNCTWTWTTQNGVNGYLVTSKKEGYTDKSIFLPAAGNCYDAKLSNVGSYGYYWSSTLNWAYSYNAYYIFFNSSNVTRINYDRFYGRSVRPVQE